MLPRVCLLLRPSHPRLPGAGHREGIRPKDRGEDQRGRTDQGPNRGPTLGWAIDCHGHQHRPLPTRRRQIPSHQRSGASVVRTSQPVFTSHKIATGAAGSSSPGRRRPPGRHNGQLLGGHPGHRCLEEFRAGHSPSPAALGGCPKAERTGDSIRRAGGASSPRHRRLAPASWPRL